MADKADKQPIGEALALEALLYLSDALPQEHTGLFERRLADDQKARDALSLAVAFVQSCEGQEAVRPDPAYREEVRRKLQPRKHWWQGLWRRREYSAHPLVWSAAGACLAALLILFAGFRLPQDPQQPLAKPAPDQNQLDEALASGGDHQPVEVARIWAEIPRGQHLLKAHEEGQRRKIRDQMFQKLGKKI